MDRERILEELRQLEEQLEDVEEEERAWFLQTGHHIGRRAFQARRRELEQDKQNLKESILRIRHVLGCPHPNLLPRREGIG